MKIKVLDYRVKFADRADARNQREVEAVAVYAVKPVAGLIMGAHRLGEVRIRWFCMEANGTQHEFLHRHNRGLRANNALLTDWMEGSAPLMSSLSGRCLFSAPVEPEAFLAAEVRRAA